jgi:SagB-type dehydrogenase family enzyme
MAQMTLEEAILGRRTRREFDDRAVPLDTLRRLLWAAQGTTDAGGNRTVPSAHALHPLCLLVAVGRIEGLDVGVHDVGGDARQLTPRISRDVRADLEKAALDEQPWIGRAAGIITVCADLVTPTRDFADQPPFGARGLRYVYIEAGAAAQNILLQAEAEGLACVLVAGFKDEATAGILELECPSMPVLHVCVGWPAEHV